MARTAEEQAQLSVASYRSRFEDRLDDEFSRVSEEYLDAAASWDALKAELPDDVSPFEMGDLVKEPFKPTWDRLVTAHSAWFRYSQLSA